MSKVNCDSCANLREYAPEFVQNGVTDNVAASLKNNTGLNPNLTVLHTDCEDLNDINDCLIGRAPDSMESYDVCDWKDFMKPHLSNLYETLKAMIAAICQFNWVRARLDRLCESLTELFRLIVSKDVMFYVPGEWTDNIKNSINIGLRPTEGAPAVDIDKFRPVLECETRSAITCDESKRSLYLRINAQYMESTHPYILSYAFSNPIPIGTRLGYLLKADFVPQYIPETVWNLWCRGANRSRLGVMAGDTYLLVSARAHVFVDGVEFNRDLVGDVPDGTAVIEVTGLIGTSTSGGMWADYYSHEVIDL